MPLIPENEKEADSHTPSNQNNNFLNVNTNMNNSGRKVINFFEEGSPMADKVDEHNRRVSNSASLL